MNTSNANDNMTLVDFIFQQFIRNDLCPKSSSALLKTHYLSGWNGQQKEAADLIFSILCDQTLGELIETIDCQFINTKPMQATEAG